MFVLRKDVFERVLNETIEEPKVVRLAKCLSSFLHENEIILSFDDILAGHAQFCDCTYSTPSGALEEVNTLFAEEPVLEKNSEVKAQLEQFLIGMRIGMYQRGPSGHVIAGYATILKKGFGSLIASARNQLNNGMESKKDFAQASLVICEAASNYALRYGAKAREIGEACISEVYKHQMERIITACEWVSLNAPRTFFEAVQLLWITHEIVIYEQYCGSMSLGRLDQYLYPFYTKDMAEGILTYEEASEIIQALWIKFGGLRKGYQNVTLGGYSSKGKYEVNDLSFICLQASRLLMIDQPLLSVRWHETIPEDFWEEIQKLIETGIGFPALFNDEVAIEAKERLGISKEDAEGYGIVGCVEISIPGKEFSHTEGFRINWAKVLDLMLNAGVCSITGESMKSPYSPILKDIKSFEEFYMWFKKDFFYFLDLGMSCINLFDKHYSKHWPTPFLSSTMTGCLEKGIDVTGGGTIYNLTTVNGCGMANVSDSLAAIKNVIYKENGLSLTEFSDILHNNFIGSEKLLKELKTKCPKFGNDDKEADTILKELTDDFCIQIDNYVNPRGGRFQSGLYTVETHAYMGKLTGALPDGRLKGVALANALSPVQGADVIGPTAVIKSITKINHRVLGNGMVLDLKFHPSFFNNNKHRLAFKYLINTYFKLGGLEIQFNVIDHETLIKAQEAPEDYKDLIVRVSGFSAYFVTLDRVLQDEIIARTQYSTI